MYTPKSISASNTVTNVARGAKDVPALGNSVREQERLRRVDQVPQRK
jgi:hypothetical protein